MQESSCPRRVPAGHRTCPICLFPPVGHTHTQRLTEGIYLDTFSSRSLCKNKLLCRWLCSVSGSCSCAATCVAFLGTIQVTQVTGYWYRLTIVVIVVGPLNINLVTLDFVAPSWPYNSALPATSRVLLVLSLYILMDLFISDCNLPIWGIMCSPICVCQRLSSKAGCAFISALDGSQPIVGWLKDLSASW